MNPATARFPRAYILSVSLRLGPTSVFFTALFVFVLTIFWGAKETGLISLALAVGMLGQALCVAIHRRFLALRWSSAASVYPWGSKDSTTPFYLQGLDQPVFDLLLLALFFGVGFWATAFWEGSVMLLPIAYGLTVYANWKISVGNGRVNGRTLKDIKRWSVLLALQPLTFVPIALPRAFPESTAVGNAPVLLLPMALAWFFVLLSLYGRRRS